MASCDLATVSRLMGHANLAMTIRYDHLSQRHEADAVAKFDAKLAKHRKTSENEEAELVKISSRWRFCKIKVELSKLCEPCRSLVI